MTLAELRRIYLDAFCDAKDDEDAIQAGVKAVVEALRNEFRVWIDADRMFAKILGDTLEVAPKDFVVCDWATDEVGTYTPGCTSKPLRAFHKNARPRATCPYCKYQMRLDGRLVQS